MSDLVPTDEIEQIVGIKRHPTRHYARAVSIEQTVYILHSHACVGQYVDLRDCPFSLALDTGIDEYEWSNVEDRTVHVTIHDGKLVPIRVRLR